MYGCAVGGGADQGRTGLPMFRVFGPRDLVGGRRGRVVRLLVEGSSSGGGINAIFSTGAVLAGLRAVVLRPGYTWFFFPVGTNSRHVVGRP